MKRVLITAFGPYGEWDQNASWIALQAVARELPIGIDVTTRLYPVDFEATREHLKQDLRTPFDVALHVGQAPGAAAVRLEAIALNTRRMPGESTDALRLLEPDGPVAYRSSLPLSNWATQLRAEGLPAEVSLHAGDYLCNAAFYWSHYFSERRLVSQQTPQTAVAFVHIPLEISQAAQQLQATPSLPAEVSGYALRRLIEMVNEPLIADPSIVVTTDQAGGLA